MKFIKRLSSVLKKVALPLFLTILVLGSLENWLTTQVQNIIRSTEGINSQLWVFAFFSFIISILTPVITSLLVICGTQPETSLHLFFKKFFQQSVIEQIRSIGSCLAWSLLLILPAFVRFIQLTYITIIVTKEPKYNQGQIDALKNSTQLANKNFLKTSGLLLLWVLLPALIFSPMAENKILWLHPFSAIIIAMIETIIAATLFLNLIQVWEKQNGTHL